ncbi:hypothetical protein N7536_005103 [Penicillium majusculum]|uniref:Uncharacterized protein n=1 Tax=Penicillium solitum TaxID=60172 RepID=A0A1V6Q717_9EURO|nr:uncharacterized protein PENSOL_c111G08659 [Penicillium solitum]KAJ5694691.1 hypothetical protein N7536_005103 [Penicillium majusculum]OQD84817.1 hypothetical protein PENSOL_c111G08659 [Penicillium solitum]
MTAPSQGRHATGTATSLAALYAPQIKGKIVLTTGVSPSGLGAAFVQVIAKWEPSVLILAGRNASKVQATAKGLVEEGSLSPSQVRTLELDLASLDAVRAAATTINNWKDVPSIDILVNNAGIMAVDHAVSPDGYESQLATNHLGPFLFTNLIMGKILASAAPRIVMVSSDGHRLCPFRFHDYNFRDGETYNRWQAYGQSKSANMLMALSLARKLGSRHNLLAFSLHPGVINTALGDHLDWNTAFPALLEIDRFFGNPQAWMTSFPFVSPDQGAATHVFAAFDPDISEHNGAYLQDCHIADPWTETVKPWATSAVEAEKLWKMSEQLVGQKFDY